MKKAKRKTALASPSAGMQLSAVNNGTTSVHKLETTRQSLKRSLTPVTPFQSKLICDSARDMRASSRQGLRGSRGPSPSPDVGNNTNTLNLNKRQNSKAKNSVKDLEELIHHMREEFNRQNEESSEKLKEKDRIINLLAKEMRAPSNENSSEASYRNNEITDQISLAKEADFCNEDLEVSIKLKSKHIKILEEELKETKDKLSLLQELLNNTKKTGDDASQKLAEKHIEIENLQLSLSNLEKEARSYILKLKEMEIEEIRKLSDLELKVAKFENIAKLKVDENEMLLERIKNYELEIQDLKERLKDSENLTKKPVHSKRKVHTDNKRQLDQEEKIQSERTNTFKLKVSTLNETVESHKQWGDYCLEALEACEQKKMKNDKKLKEKIMVLQDEKMILEDEIINLDKRNRELTDFVDIDNAYERIKEICQIFNSLKTDLTNLELVRLKKRYGYILKEYKRWKEVISHKTICLKKLSCCIAKAKAQLENLNKPTSVVIPEEKLPFVIDLTSQTPLVLSPIEEMEVVEDFSLKRPRFFTVPMSGLRDTVHSQGEKGDNVVCDTCNGIDPPGSPNNNSQEEFVEWVGCECERWFHKKCLNLSPIELESFSCDKVKKICLDGFITIE